MPFRWDKHLRRHAQWLRAKREWDEAHPKIPGLDDDWDAEQFEGELR